MQSFIFFIFAVFLSAPVFAACTDPDGVPGEVMYNQDHNIFQGCTKRGWVAFHTSLPPDCPDIGDTCKDGTLYAGEINGHKLYVAAADAPSKRSWALQTGATGMGYCTSPYTASSCNDGLSNTQLLKNHVYTYPAAEYCADLDAHGYDSGWYLPSRNELEMVYTNLKAGKPGGTHGFYNDSYYWSSSDAAANSVRVRMFSGGVWTTTGKVSATERVRCVRQ